MEQKSESERPLRVEHRRVMLDPPRFVPESLLVVTPALKDCGLLVTLTDREARTLLAVLSLLTADGRFEAPAPAVARVLGTTDRNAGERLRDLSRVRWRAESVVIEVPREQALPVWVPAPTVVSRVLPPEPFEEKPLELNPGAEARSPEESPAQESPAAPSRREQIYRHSRARYARTREEVEAQVLKLMGKDPQTRAEQDQDTARDDPAEGTAEAQAFQALLAFGVPRPTARLLLERFGAERCQRQAGWMGRRAARDPSRFLVAAIENDYDPPKGV